MKQEIKIGDKFQYTFDAPRLLTDVKGTEEDLIFTVVEIYTDMWNNYTYVMKPTALVTEALGRSFYKYGINTLEKYFVPYNVPNSPAQKIPVTEKDKMLLFFSSSHDPIKCKKCGCKPTYIGTSFIECPVCGKI